jgi:hypothetical protein
MKVYEFGNLDNHAAIIIQQAIENRKMSMTSDDSKALQQGDKVLKALVQELDQMYDDLDRHISSNVRREEYAEKARRIEARDSHLPQELT